MNILTRIAVTLGILKLEYHWTEFYSDHIIQYNKQTRRGDVSTWDGATWDLIGTPYSEDFSGRGNLRGTSKTLRSVSVRE